VARDPKQSKGGDKLTSLQTREAAPSDIQESENLIRMAIDKDIDIAKLEKLIELRNAQQERQAKADYEQHFAAMQAEFVPVSKTKNGYENRFKYAPLDEIQRIYGPIIAKHGFSYRHREESIEAGGKRVYMRISGWGYSEETFFDIPRLEANRMQNPIQIMGAMSTYGRRYTFMSGFGVIVADEDADDSDHVKQEQHKPATRQEQAAQVKQEPQKQQPQKQEPRNVTPADITKSKAWAEILDLLGAVCKPINDPAGWTPEEREKVGAARILKIAREQHNEELILVARQRVELYNQAKGTERAKEALALIAGTQESLIANQALAEQIAGLLCDPQLDIF
jgi:hypothetical protein